MTKIDLDFEHVEITEPIAKSLQALAEFTSNRLSEGLSNCDSPIEYALGIALYVESLGRDTKHHITFADPETGLPYHNITTLSPQYKVNKYRLDFLLSVPCMNGTLLYAIECDGHDFHQKTKLQAQRDKKRDRYLTSKGYRVYRFTGSEIWKDPIGCASQIFEAVFNDMCQLDCPELYRHG